MRLFVPSGRNQGIAVIFDGFLFIVFGCSSSGRDLVSIFFLEGCMC